MIGKIFFLCVKRLSDQMPSFGMRGYFCEGSFVVPNNPVSKVKPATSEMMPLLLRFHSGYRLRASKKKEEPIT